MKTLFEKRQLLTETDKIKFVENGLFLKSKDKFHLSDGYHLTISNIGVFTQRQINRRHKRNQNNTLNFDKFDLLIMLGCTDVGSAINTSADCKKLFIDSFWENKLNAISEEVIKTFSISLKFYQVVLHFSLKMSRLLKDFV